MPRKLKKPCKYPGCAKLTDGKYCEEHAKAMKPMLLNQYAMSAGRYIECESINSSMGLLARHPTTGAPIASPYVSMSDMYAKRMQSIWEQIYRVVKENCSVDYQGESPQADVMERLLRARSGG